MAQAQGSSKKSAARAALLKLAKKRFAESQRASAAAGGVQLVAPISPSPRALVADTLARRPRGR